jgi:uncharacterized protein (DUF58 family)
MANPFDFDSAFLQKLERMALLSRHPLAGPAAGARRSPRRGPSVEFADFRVYTPGDDFRRIDWKAYGRLDRLFLRLYSAEETATLTIFLDHSTSMRFGAPPKSLLAARLAAVLAFIALHNHDLVAVAGWGDTLDRYDSPRGGRAATADVWNRIATLMDTPEGLTDFRALRRFEHLRRGSGLAVVISDLLTESDWQGGLRALRAAGQEVSLVQVLDPEELSPTIRGDWELRDAENGQKVEITVSPRLLKRYAEELARHTAAIQEYCRRHDITFLRLRSDAPLVDTVLSDLHAAGVLA